MSTESVQTEQCKTGRRGGIRKIAAMAAGHLRGLGENDGLVSPNAVSRRETYNGRRAERIQVPEESLAFIGTASSNKPGEGSTMIRGGFDNEA